MLKTSHLNRLVIAALFIAWSVGAFSGPAKAAPGFLSSNIPTQVFPKDTIPITRIVYIWTSVSGATQYQYQVYQDTIQILDISTSTAVCVSGTCVVMPAIDLATGSYMWRVRATIGGVLQPYSPWMAFVVAVESTGFYSPFTSNAVDWVIHKGTWNLEGSNYFATPGVAGYASTISHTGDFSTLTYEVRMKRAGCVGCANVLAIRGNPILDGTGWWKTEYTFDYTNNGLFSVWKDNNGTYTALKNWTTTTAINQGGWNTLKVTANGSALKFYINGMLVWSGSDSSYPTGRVGIGMYRSTTSTGNKLWVDWAQLVTTVTAAPDPSIVDSGEEVPSGDKNKSP